jgi:hypothetical protein
MREVLIFTDLTPPLDVARGFGGVEKVVFLSSTPISPRGDFLVCNMLQFPPWGVRGCKTTFSTAPY